MSDSDVVPLREGDAALAEEARTATRLVRAIRTGDAAAEGQMIARYSRGLGFLLARKCHDAERARDLLQDTFCIALEKLRTTDLDNPERLAGYLRGIAVRVALNAGRRRKREPLPIDDEQIKAMPDPLESQYREIDDAQRAGAVRELLDALPVERDRELLLRYYVYDQDKEEVCDALGLESLHFNRVIYRAKQRFRAILERRGADFGLDDNR
jgi:RNA polymerase sigma-70 factor (ECF subfamily)